MIITADLHLTDAPADEYRWQVFNRLIDAAWDNDDGHICILGDLTDRKDRHSAALVNRLIAALENLRNSCKLPQIDIIMGNHDMPLKGPAFWSWLSNLPGINFYTEPHALPGGLMLLPYAADPRTAWAGLHLDRCKAIFMHQTVTGVVENGQKLVNDKMPILPRGIPIYSGDIHTPQKVGPVQYVGAPHPIKFGDDYPCRLLVLDNAFKISKIIECFPPAKHMFDIASVAELAGKGCRPGDQARIRYQLALEGLEGWPAIRQELSAWAAAQGVAIASVEAIVQAAPRQHVEAPELYSEPLGILAAFAQAEGLGGALLAQGQRLLQETLAAQASR
jgi:hypothetical protein